MEVIADGDKIASLRGENIEGTVRVCSGPWRMEEGWWRDAPAERQYWDVELWGGGIYRLYQAGDSKGWYVDARFGV